MLQLGAVGVCACTVLAGYAVWKILSFYRQSKRWTEAWRKLPHCDNCHWLWGDLDQNMKNFQDVLDKTQRFVDEGVKIYAFWMGFLRMLVTVLHPETVKAILRTSTPKAKSLGAYGFFLPWLGDGLLISDGHKWERNRKLLTPAFHFDILKPYVKIYNSVADTLVDKLATLSEDGGSLDVVPHVSLATLDTMLQCSLSYTGNVQSQGNTHPYVRAVVALTESIEWRYLHPPMYVDFLYRQTERGKQFQKFCDFVHDFADNIITARRKALEADPEVLNRRHLDFLDILLTARDDMGKGLTDQEIRDEVDTFMFEGHDTTASAISWSLYCLAKYQEEQEKVFQETETLFSEGEDVQWEGLAQLSYTTMFLKEVMRTHPPVPFVSRELTEDMELDGVVVPKGVFIEINFYHLHKHPKVWPNPKEFRPDRFDPAKTVGKDPYDFVPFAAGPRNCIGQNFAMNEIKVVIAKILHKFRVDVDPERLPKVHAVVVLRSENGIHLYLTPRKS